MPPNLTGYYRFVSQNNMESYLRALDINVALRKLVCLLKPDKEIIHTGDHMIIRTLTSLRNYVMDFDVGVEFEEDLGAVDGRKCQTTVSWEGDQLVCEQRGEKRNRGWRHWLEGDKLHLMHVEANAALGQCNQGGGIAPCTDFSHNIELPLTTERMTAEDEVCVQVFQKVK